MTAQSVLLAQTANSRISACHPTRATLEAAICSRQMSLATATTPVSMATHANSTSMSVRQIKSSAVSENVSTIMEIILVYVQVSFELR